MKTELFISVYNDRIRNYLEELIRVIARRTQTALWGRSLADMSERNSDLLILDSGGRIWDFVATTQIIDSAYKEYVIFKEGGRPVHIISPLKGVPGGIDREKFSELLVKRCSFIDSKRRAVFAAVDGDPVLKSAEYREMCRKVKSVISRGEYTELSYDTLTGDAWKASADVFIADEYTNNAVLLGLANINDPVIMHLGSDENNIYVPLSSLRSVCFVPHKKSMIEAVFCVSLWLFDMGLSSPAKRLNSLLVKTERPWYIAREFEKPVKRRSGKGEKDDGASDQA